MNRSHSVMHKVTKGVMILTALIAGIAMAGYLFDAVQAYPVPELPADNLIINPWFRDASDPSEAGYDGWQRPLTDGVTWGPSQKESNPSPDIVVSGVCSFEAVYCGTAARWAEQFGTLYPHVDVYAYQVVAADPTHRTLKFFAHYVSHLVEVGAVNIYAGQSPDGPWELLWVPLFHTESDFIIPESGESRDLWLETGFLEWTFEQGYPYYKVELHSRLPESPIENGIRGVGFKITGIYFSTSPSDEEGESPPTPNYSSSTLTTATRDDSTNGPTAVSATPAAIASNSTPRATSASAETNSASTEMGSVAAEGISSSEIFITLGGMQDSGRGVKIERSLDPVTGWKSIIQTGPGVNEYLDIGLSPDTIYYYRVRASQDQFSDITSARTFPAPEISLTAPDNLMAISRQAQGVELRWRDLTEDETGFALERSQDGANFALIETLNPNAISYIDEGLDPAVYYYRLRAFRDDAFSDYTEIISVAVIAPDEERVIEATATTIFFETSTPNLPESPDDMEPTTQSLLLIIGLGIFILIIGVALGAALVRRRQ